MADDAQYDQMPYGESGPDEEQTGGNGKRKRRADSSGTARKRNRYINIAW